MNFIKDNWLPLLIVIVLILLINHFRKTGNTNNTVSQQAQQTFSTIANNLSSNPVVTSVLPNNNNSQTSQFKFGDLIYAKNNFTNAYKNPVLSTANLDSYKPFNANDLIGTFVSYNGTFVKVIAQNPAREVYVQASQVYTK